MYRECNFYYDILVDFQSKTNLYKMIYSIFVINNNDLKIKTGSCHIYEISPGFKAEIIDNPGGRPHVSFRTREGFEEKYVDPSTSEIDFFLIKINNEFKNRNIEFIETYDNNIKIIKHVYEKIQP